MKCFIQVLGTETHDSNSSLLIFFDQKRYVINVNEGLFRFCTEYKVKVAKMQHMFLSRLHPDQCGGLPGFLLTLADANAKQVDVFGPENLTYYLANMKRFMRRKDVTVHAHELPGSPTSSSPQIDFPILPQIIHQDENMTMRAIVLQHAATPEKVQAAQKDDRARLAALEVLNEFVVIDDFKDKEWNTKEIEFPAWWHNRVKVAKQQRAAIARAAAGEDGAVAMDEDEGPENPDAFVPLPSYHGMQQQQTTDNSTEAAASASSAPESEDAQPQMPAAKKPKTTQGSTKMLTYRGRWNLEVDGHLADRVSNFCKSEGRNGDTLPSLTQAVTCYVCHLADIPGKFDPKKAIGLGLKPGPLYSQLTKGQSVTLEDGVTVITPDMVIGPSQPGPVVIYIHCPDESFVDLLVSNPQWVSYQLGQSASSTKPVPPQHKAHVIVHSTPFAITSSEKYRQFMSRFGTECQHILVSKDICPQRLIFKSSAHLQCKLNLINEQVFPIPSFNESQRIDPAELKKIFGKDLKVMAADTLLKYHLSPPKTAGMDNTELPASLSVSETQNEILQHSSAIRPLIDEYRASLLREAPLHNPHHARHQEVLRKLSDREMSIVFLGTGAACPSKYRNVSSTYLHFFERGGILLDCGEGTLGQLYRMYGEQAADAIVRNLSCIWVSHLHADHHLGLSRILSKRQELLASSQQQQEHRLLIIGSESVGLYMENFNLCFSDRIYDYEYVNCRTIMQANHGLLDSLMKKLGLTQFYNINVSHSCEAYGLIVQHQNGWKFVHSGDTRPCQRLIDEGRDATVLVHEATFEDGMQQEAIDKKHSTTQEAIQSGIQMDAYRIILSHFSQRYPKIPVFDKSFTEVTSIAFDMTAVNLKDLDHMPHTLKPVQEVFREELEELGINDDSADGNEALQQYSFCIYFETLLSMQPFSPPKQRYQLLCTAKGPTHQSMYQYSVFPAFELTV